MSFDLKAELLAIASSHEGKTMLADVVQELASRTDNNIDNSLADLLTKALGVDKPADAGD